MEDNITIDSTRSSEIMLGDFDDRCAPSISFSNKSCIKLNILIDMVKAYNEEHQNDQIKLYPNFETLNPSKYKRYLLKQVNIKLSDKCTSQKCWTEQDFIENMKDKSKEELIKYTFRPEGPEGKFEWLNTINIDEVMKQYEKKYNDFKFLGALPIDFNDLPFLGIRNLNLNDLIKNNKTKIGVIFNLDRHDESGSHWVALYCDLLKGLIYFYDSYGIPPKKEIRSFMRKLYSVCENTINLKNIISDHNKIRHQYENSECGVYSINFILRMLNGDSFEKICNDKTPDNVINKMRNIYFFNARV